MGLVWLFVALCCIQAWNHVAFGGSFSEWDAGRLERIRLDEGRDMLPRLGDAGEAFLFHGELQGYAAPLDANGEQKGPVRRESKLPVELDSLQMHGTTTLAFTYKDGVVIAVDSRASVGSYVGSRTVKKVFPISPHIVATMAGGAADCAHWIRRTARRVQLLEEDFASVLPVSAVAQVLARSLREYKGSDLSIGTMIAGVDVVPLTPTGDAAAAAADAAGKAGGRARARTHPRLFYVDSEANCVSGDCFCVGSGAALAYGLLDAAAPDGMDSLPSLETVVDVAVRAIRQATYRDAYSGGYINVLHVNATGIHHLRRVDSRTVVLPPVYPSVPGDQE